MVQSLNCIYVSSVHLADSLHVLIDLHLHGLFFFFQLIPIVQTKSEKKPAVNGSYFAQINPADKGCLLEKYSSKYTDCEFGLLANLYASEGQPGKVCTWIKGDFACGALWLKGNSQFNVLLLVVCDNNKVVIS